MLLWLCFSTSTERLLHRLVSILFTGAVSTDIEKSGNDADKTSMAIDNSSAKVEMFAREFAETGLRDMTWAITSLLLDKGVLQAEGLRKEDLMAKVGLGHLTASQKIRSLGVIKQEQMMYDQTMPGLIGIDKKLALSEEIIKSQGYENTSKFLPTIEEATQMQNQIQQAFQAGQQQGMQEGAAAVLQDAEITKTQAEAAYKASQVKEIEADIIREDAELVLDQQRVDADIRLTEAAQTQGLSGPAQIKIG